MKNAIILILCSVVVIQFIALTVLENKNQARRLKDISAIGYLEMCNDQALSISRDALNGSDDNAAMKAIRSIIKLFESDDYRRQINSINRY